MQPGTVEWVQTQGQNRAELEILRQIMRNRKIEQNKFAALVIAARRFLREP